MGMGYSRATGHGGGCSEVQRCSAQQRPVTATQCTARQLSKCDPVAASDLHAAVEYSTQHWLSQQLRYLKVYS